MAQRRRTNQSRRPPARKRPQKKPVNILALFQRKQVDFKPDAEGSGFLKKLYITEVQRDTLFKWGGYAVLIILLLTIQDVIMSRITIFGTTTDLAACVILLITVLEGIETGSIFVLVASTLFYFSGSSPGPYTIALLSILGIGACMFRQMYWHRSRGSIVLCGGLALMLYEMATYITGILTGLTRWDRISAFAITGLISWVIMVPLYSLVNKIGLIGGNTWKE